MSPIRPAYLLAVFCAAALALSACDQKQPAASADEASEAEASKPAAEESAEPTPARLEEKLEVVVETCEEIRLPNSQARPEGFDLKAHLQKLEKRRQEAAQAFSRPEGIEFLEQQLDKTDDEMRQICMLQVLLESDSEEAQEIVDSWRIRLPASATIDVEVGGDE